MVTELAAVDTELGIVKTGKEADVFLVERAVPGTDRRTLMAAKRYRDSQHRMFHRDSGYLEGRAHKESRVSRAMAKRTAFGKEAIAGQWAGAEFSALCRLWSSGVAVPYPVQIVGTEILMEFIGDATGAAAPRLAQLSREEADLTDLWEQLGHSLSLLARQGYAHGDLSPYNLLVHEGRLVVIDVPQIVDVVANPRGRAFLERDVRNVGSWFTARGLPSPRWTGSPPTWPSTPASTDTGDRPARRGPGAAEAAPGPVSPVVRRGAQDAVQVSVGALLLPL
ncbi:serine protein kinase RIO [Streptacidiphilus monticola]